MRFPNKLLLEVLKCDPCSTFEDLFRLVEPLIHPYLQADKLRLSKMAEYEVALSKDQGCLFGSCENSSESYIAGADEVGRGPMAGPLVAAAVSLSPDNFCIPGLCDSKLITPEVREALIPWIKAKAKSFCITETSVEELNTVNNILTSSLEAMRKSFHGLKCPIKLALIDGNSAIPNFAFPQKTVIQGDRRCLSIAAASVLAKVYRDNCMDEAEKIWPGYGFAIHKGYCTRKHLLALAKLGPTSFHRTSYAPIQEFESHKSHKSDELQLNLDV